MGGGERGWGGLCEGIRCVTVVSPQQTLSCICVSQRESNREREADEVNTGHSQQREERWETLKV